MKRALAGMISIGVAAALAAGPPGGAASKPAATFTVATYNINWRNVDLPTIVKTIREAKADVVFLQETNRQSARYFRRRLRGTYRYMVFRDQRGAGGFGILSKTRLRKVRLLPRSAGHWGPMVAETTLAGRKLQLVNVHLIPTVPRGDENLKQLIARFTKAEKIRMKEIADIHSRLKAKGPKLMVGDFNSPPWMSVVDFITKRRWTDSHAAGAADGADLHTWHHPVGGKDWRQRLDYIFHTPEARTHSSRVIRSKASDHYLVLSTLSWAPKNATTRPADRRPVRTSTDRAKGPGGGG